MRTIPRMIFLLKEVSLWVNPLRILTQRRHATADSNCMYHFEIIVVWLKQAFIQFRRSTKRNDWKRRIGQKEGKEKCNSQTFSPVFLLFSCLLFKSSEVDCSRHGMLSFLARLVVSFPSSANRQLVAAQILIYSFFFLPSWRNERLL